MEITPEIASLFGSEADQLERVEITYQNGGKVIGTVKRARLRPLRVVIQKSHPEKGERSKHRVVFDHVIRIRVTLRDGSTRNYPEQQA